MVVTSEGYVIADLLFILDK